MTVEDYVVVLAPALFGVAGTAVGGLIAMHASVVQRQSAEDNEARKALSGLFSIVEHAAGHYGPGRAGQTTFLVPPPGSYRTLRQKLDQVQAAALGAGVPWLTTHWALMSTGFLADLLEQHETTDTLPEEEATQPIQQTAERAITSLDRLLAVLDRPRRYRRSAAAARRVGAPPDLRHQAVSRLRARLHGWAGGAMPRRGAPA